MEEEGATLPQGSSREEEGSLQEEEEGATLPQGSSREEEEEEAVAMHQCSGGGLLPLRGSRAQTYTY